MKQAVKAVLLSGLVLPGLGQIVLKQYPRGLAFMLVALASSLYIVTTAVSQALASLATLDPASPPLPGPLPGGDHAGPALWVLGICWAWAVLDAYRGGAALDRLDKDGG